MEEEKPCKFRSQFVHVIMGMLLRIEIKIHFSMCFIVHAYILVCNFNLQRVF